MKVRHNLIDFQQWATFGKNVGLFHTIVGMNCVAAIEADDFRCGSFGCRTFYLQWGFLLASKQVQSCKATKTLVERRLYDDS